MGVTCGVWGEFPEGGGGGGGLGVLKEPIILSYLVWDVLVALFHLFFGPAI